MTRKLLFILFTTEPCRRNHAFMYALDLARHGHDVRLLLEGEAVRCVAEREGRFGELFEEARSRGLLAGVCKTASAGCNDPSRNVTELAIERGLEIRGDMDGHAGIDAFVSDGYEVVTF
jgi:hypothetical protein